MKKVLLLVTSLLFSAVASADYDGPIIIKTNHSGHVPQDWVASETCEVYGDKAVITKTFGKNGVVKEVRVIDASGLNELVEASRHAEITETDNGLCDGPSTHIKATNIRPNGTIEDVLLYQTGGCGAHQKVRVGAQAHHLTSIVSMFCPTTYK